MRRRPQDWLQAHASEWEWVQAWLSKNCNARGHYDNATDLPAGIEMFKDAQYKMAAQQEWQQDGVSSGSFPWKKKLLGAVCKLMGRDPPVVTTHTTYNTHNTRTSNNYDMYG